MSEIKLLPCPFCGGKFEEINNTSCKQGDNWLWSTECMECGLFIEDKDKENLIKRINTRKPMERIVERLEKYKRANDMCRENAASAKRHENVRYFENLIFATEQAISMVKEEGGIE